MNFKRAGPVYVSVIMPCPENTSAPLRSVQASELRSRICQLREDLARTTDRYHSARKLGDHSEVMALLRKRTQLVRQLFQAQSELLLVFRTDNLSEGQAIDPPERF